jgi:hypothetical protein
MFLDQRTFSWMGDGLHSSEKFFKTDITSRTPLKLDFQPVQSFGVPDGEY